MKGTVSSLSKLFKREKVMTSSKRAEHTNLALLDIRDSIIQDINSQELISYDASKALIVQTEFNEKDSKDLTSPVYDVLTDYHELQMLMSIENGSDCVNVSYPDDGMCVYVEVKGVGIVAVPTRDGVHAEEAIVLLAALQRRALLPSLKVSMLSLKRAQLDAQNDTMLADLPSEASIDKWFACRETYSMLRKGFASNVRLFLGTTLDKKLLEGDIVPLHGFTRWFFSIGKANSYGSHIFAIYPEDKIEGAFVAGANELSNSVLVNAGYQVRVTRVISMKKYHECDGDKSDSVVYVCTLEKDESYAPKLASCFESADDGAVNRLTDSLLELPLHNQIIGKIFYVCVSDGKSVEFRRMFTNRSVPFEGIRVVLEGNKVVLYGVKGKDTNKWKSVPVTTYNDTYIGVEKLLVEVAIKMMPEVHNVLYTFGVDFMYNLSSKFLSEGYHIIQQWYSSQGETVDKLAMSGLLVLAGERDNIVLKFRVNQGMTLDLDISCGNAGTRNTLDVRTGSPHKDVFKLITSRFMLAQYGRMRQALSLVARYKRVPFTAFQDTVGYYKLGNWECAVAYKSGFIEVSDASNRFVEFPYSASLIGIMEQVLTLIDADPAV